MPYTIKRYNGQTLGVIQDGTVDTETTDLQLPGKNYAGYGSALNQSLVYLLENFANSTEPTHKVTGQLWFDTSVKKIKVYNGINFRPLGTIEHGSDAPSNQLIGDMWFNTTTNQLFVYDGSVHKLIGPLLTNPNAAQLVSKKLIETGGNPRTVLETVVNNEVVAIFSNQEFTIKDDQTPVAGFSVINKGINLPSTSVIPNIRLNGVARTAQSLLVGTTEIAASNFVRNTGSPQTLTTNLSVRVEPDVNSSGTVTNYRGIFVGGSDNFFLGYNGGTGFLTNLTGSAITLGVTNSGLTSRVLTVDNLNTYPNIDSNNNLGTSNYKWKSVYANNFYAVDNPSLAPNNAAFNGRVIGTSVSASVGFSGNLTGNVRGNVQKVDGTNVLTVSGDIPVFNGRTNGPHYGNVVNLNASVQNQIAVDTSGATTIFRGSFSGTSSTSSTLTIGSTAYPGYIGNTASVQNDYASTVVVRDVDGSIRATQYYGISEKAQSLIDPSTNQAYPGSVGQAPFTVVIRDAAGAINVGAITGTTTNSSKLDGLSQSAQALPATIAARDSAGDLYAGVFHGRATSASYADLAEKYLPDQDYEPGTVVKIGGEKEITACSINSRAIGVISTDPAYMMNKDLVGGVYVALKGRVPCKVSGPVNKGDELVAGTGGVAMVDISTESEGKTFAVALESSDDEGVKVIEVLVL